MKKSLFLKILTNKNFLKIWLAQVISLVSAYALNFILIGRIFAVTQSTVAVSFFLFLYYLPTMILGPFIGVFIDNLSKRKIFVLSNLFQAVIVLAYLGIGEKIWAVYAIVFLYSLCDELFNPAVGVALPALVKKKSLPVANSFFLLTSQGSIMVGALIGGLALKFLKWVDFTFVLVSFLLFLVVAISLSLPKKPLRGTKKIKIDFSDLSSLSKALDLPAFWRQTKEGYRFIKNEPLVLFPILVLTGLQGLVAMGLIVLPSLAEMLKINFADSSFLVIIPAILGVFLASYYVSKTISKVRKNVLVLAGLYLSGIAIFSLAFFTLFGKHPYLIALPIFFILGAGAVLIFIPLQTLIQEYTPFDVRGRVFGALNTMVNLGAVLPLLFTATLVDLFGLRFIMLMTGAFIILLGVFAKKRQAMIIAVNNKLK
ncbi:MAG TPA: MFS transporter [Nevskiaceae bacterium]|nr:MFS transporter [Nevskiaceae bacterium]